MYFDWLLVRGISLPGAQLFVIAIENILRGGVGNLTSLKNIKHGFEIILSKKHACQYSSTSQSKKRSTPSSIICCVVHCPPVDSTRGPRSPGVLLAAGAPPAPRRSARLAKKQKPNDSGGVAVDDDHVADRRKHCTPEDIDRLEKRCKELEAKCA